jgi:nucleoside-diphosphate-sugar epimerase
MLKRHDIRTAHTRGGRMKVVVIGGSGLIGSKLVTKLHEHGHEAVAASLDTHSAHGG